MAEDSLSCHRVYRPASVLGSLGGWGGLAATHRQHFIHLAESKKKSAFQFYGLIPFGIISVTPGMSTAQGMEKGKYAGCFLRRLCTCERLKTPTH